MSLCKVVQLLALVQLFQSSISSEDLIQLEISTDPPGPSYPASSWVRFACKADNHSDPRALRYEWRGCRSSEEDFIIHIRNAPLEDLAAITWLLSTSMIQYIECQVFNRSTSNMIASVGQTLSVTGVGVSLEETFDGGLENNTSILNPYSQEITVVCQSALRDPCRSGGWKSPNNTYIVSPEQNRSCSTDVDIFSSTRLTVSPDLPDGLYTCVIPDESLIMRSIYIGIYSHFEEKIIPFRSSMTLTHKVDQNKLTLSCATAHLPSSSVVWQRDNIVVSRLETRTELTDVANAGYSNNLDVVWNSNGVSKVSCEVFTEWKTPDQPYYDSVGTRGNFVIAQLGSSTSIQCPTLGNIASTIWLDSNNGVFNTSQYPELIVMGSVMILSNVTERVHGLQFQCRGYDASGRAQQWHHYSIVVSVPPDIVTVSLVDDSRQAEDGKPYNITCCYTIDSPVPVSAPFVEWYQDEELIDTTRDPGVNVVADDQCSTLTFVSVKEEQNGKTVSCTAQWRPSFLYTGIPTNHTTHTVLNVTESKGVTDFISSSGCKHLFLPHLLTLLLLTAVYFNL